FFLLPPVEAKEPARFQTLHPPGEIGNRFVIGGARRCRAAGGGGVEGLAHALARQAEQALEAPAALSEEHHGIQRNGRKHARRELFTRKRRVGDGRLLRIAEAGAHARAVRAGATNNLAGSGERRVVAVLRDDAAELEEQRRVVVPEADDVEQLLRVGGANDLLVVVRSLAADRLGPKAGGAPARQEPE